MEKLKYYYRTYFLKNKALSIALLVGVLLLTLAIVLIFIQAVSTPEKNQSQALPTVIPTQPVPKEIPFEKTTPSDQATLVGLYQPVSVDFSRPLTLEEQHTVSIDLTPTVKGDVAWSNNGKTITFTPQDNLNSSKLYSAHLRYKTVLYTWTFTIAPAEKVSQQDVLKEQAQAEVNYKNAEQKFYQQYPWYDSLPLQTDSYFVYFEKDKNVFMGLLYPKTTTGVSVDSQVTSMKQDITSKLQALGVNLTTYSITWKITPEP